MTNEKVKDADQVVEASMSKLFGSMGSATANPLTASAKSPITGRFKISGVVLKDDGQPAVGISIGMMGTECTTNQRGEFTLEIEKKS